MRADVPATRDAAAAADAAEPEPGFARLWASIKSMLLGLVRIERRDEPVAHALSAAERELGRRELEIELEVARTAALRGAAAGVQERARRGASGCSSATSTPTPARSRARSRCCARCAASTSIRSVPTSARRS